MRILAIRPLAKDTGRSRMPMATIGAIRPSPKRTLGAGRSIVVEEKAWEAVPP